MRVAALGVVLSACVALAQEDGGMSLLPAAQDAGVTLEPPHPPRRNFLVPALESEAFHLGFLAFSNLVSRESFAQVSWDSTLSHFDGRRPFQWDVDYFITNQFGHPFQGALAFTAARSSGLSFWWSALYPLFASLTWELFYEVDAPSFNDMIITPIGGILLGEVLHRVSLLVLKDLGEGKPSLLRRVGAFLVNPVGRTNAALFDDELGANDVERKPPFFAMLGAGINIGSAFRDPDTLRIVRREGVQANVQGRLTYGRPGDPNFVYRYPFSHFDVDFNITAPGVPVTSFFIRGLVVGGQFGGPADELRGVWGLFGQYDFSAAALVRISSVGFGVGTSFQWRLSSNVFLQAAGVASGVPFATAGSLGLDENKYRDYHIGPGAQLTMELRLIHRWFGWLRLVARSWFTVGAYTPPIGWESITYVTGGPLVRIIGPLAIGADVVTAFRSSYFEDNTFDRSVNGVTMRLTLNWLSDEEMGVVEPRTPH